MSALTSGKLKWMLYIYIYIYFFFFFAKEVKRIMSWTNKLTKDVLRDKNYRVWSLTGQGFLKLTGTDSADFSGTAEESSSNTKILLIVLL